MTTFTETEARPMFISRMRRLSKSNFDMESQQKCPRLDKMIAHVNLFDKTTRCLEEQLVQLQRTTSTEKRTDNMPTSPSPQPQRPAAQRRGSEHRKSTEEVPSWIADLTERPAQTCVVVTEIEDTDDFNSESL